MKIRKIALVTGASSEIGLAIIRRLLVDQYQVYGQINRNKLSVQEFESDSNFNQIESSLNDADQARNLVNKVISAAGSLDILVNTIGPFDQKNILDLRPDEWDQQVHLNLNLAYYLTHAAKQHLVESKGHIINFAFSGAEIVKARVHGAPYCISKIGILILTKSLAAALGPSNVRVNAISPGLIENNESQNEERKKMRDSVPMGRAGRPDEVADTLAWLINGSPEYLTGASVAVSGGWEYL